MSDDSEDDPFESLDAPDDVDPFEDLEGPPEDDDTESDETVDGDTATDAAADTSQPDQPMDDAAEDSYTPPGGNASDVPFGADAVSGADAADSVDSDDPFASFSGPVGETGSSGDDPFGAFEAVDVEGVDPDDVWNELSAAEQEGMPEFDEKIFYEVSKHKFCENCEYFSEPPEVACNHDGAAIVEFLDMETVRLLNCPIVAEQRELEEGVNDIG